MDVGSHQERATDGHHPVGRSVQELLYRARRYPRFRKKGVHDRFTLTNDQCSVDGCRLRIPNLGWVRLREPLRFAGKIMSATISRVADRWFVSLTVDIPATSHLPKAENQGVVGVDLGVSAFAVLSTGEPPIPGPSRTRRCSSASSAYPAA